jgi:hypothetical protein
MRTIALAAGCVLAGLVPGQTYADAASESIKPGEPKVYALIAAVGEQFTFRPEDVQVEREVLTDWLVQSEGPYVIALDPVLSDELMSWVIGVFKVTVVPLIDLISTSVSLIGNFLASAAEILL